MSESTNKILKEIRDGSGGGSRDRFYIMLTEESTRYCLDCTLDELRDALENGSRPCVRQVIDASTGVATYFWPDVFLIPPNSTTPVVFMMPAFNNTNKYQAISFKPDLETGLLVSSTKVS